MHRATRSLAALLSLLIVSTPVSAWACDLSCSFQQVHSDCHDANSVTTSKDNRAMTMSPDMDMGPDQSEGTVGSDAGMNAKPGHSMSMSPRLEMATKRHEHVMTPEMGTSAVHDHSKSVSSCTHDTCSQVSASASPPGAVHSQPNSLHRMAASIWSPVNLLVDFHWVRLGAPPPKLLTADHLITTLRI